MSKKLNATKFALCAGATALTAITSHSQAQSTADALINKLEQKGILSVDEAKQLRSESAAADTNLVNSLPASKWKLADSIKSIGLYGDLRVRYEYRGVDNTLGGSPNTYYRERMRYALRFGLRGDLYDDFSYGIRLETSNNPRSPWDTFGNNTTSGSVTPSDKNSSGIYFGQAFINWHPESWYEMTVGRMPQPLYTTPMVWDSDINPEGAFEKFKYTAGPVDLFADFGQFDYQDPGSPNRYVSSDIFLLTWQAGANIHLNKTMAFKIAPVVYTYTGSGSVSGGLGQTFVGQGSATGTNPGISGGASQQSLNQEGINDLLFLEIPAEFNWDITKSIHGRVFGDFAYNFQGDDRAAAAYSANPAAFPDRNGPAYGPITPTKSGSASAAQARFTDRHKAWFMARLPRNARGKRELIGSISNNMRWT